MPLVSDRCICLRKYEYSETSQILTLFGREHGIVRVIAKGAYRRTKAGASKFGGGVDLLDIGQAVFTWDPAKELSTLTEWSLQEGNLFLRNDLRTMYLALYAGELVGLLIQEHDSHPELFDRLERVLAEVASERREEAFLAFELDLLRFTGYLSDFSTCLRCHKPITDARGLKFSASRGGLVCGQCSGQVGDAIPFDIRLARLIASVLRLPRSNGWIQRLPRLTRHQTDPINQALLSQMEYTLSRHTHMGKLIVGR